MGAAVKLTLSIGVVALLIAGLNSSAAPESSVLSGWSVPLNLGPAINSIDVDGGPTLSEDGLNLFFGSTRAGGAGGNDIWITQRTSPTDAWGPPVNVGAPVNTVWIDQAPSLSRDGHRMFLNSDRPGGFGSNDVWVAYRDDVHDNFGWQTPVNLGPGVNTAFIDQGAYYFENDDAGVPMLFFGSNRPGGMGASDIYVSAELPDGSFGAAKHVKELSSPYQDLRAVVRFDGLETFFFSDRPEGLREYDLWVSTRDSLSDPWTPPVNLGAPVNSVRPDQQPWLASDRRTLYFASSRPGGLGGLDLYVTTRANRPPEPHAGGPVVGFEGSPTTFDASDSSDPDGDPLQFRWDFTDDGTWDTGWNSIPTATHEFGDDWNGIARVQVTDSELTEEATTTVTVRNVAPSASVASVIQEHDHDLPRGHFYPLDPITFNGPAFDPGSDDLSFAWEFGDGTSLAGGTYFNDGLGPDPPNSLGGTSPFDAGDSVLHAYDLPGDYVVRLSVWDDDGGEATEEFSIHITSAADLKQEAIRRIKALKEQALDHGDWRFVRHLDDAERSVWMSLGHREPFRPVGIRTATAPYVSVARNRAQRVDLVLGALWTPRLRGYDSLMLAWDNGDVTTVDLPDRWPSRSLRYHGDLWIDAWKQDVSILSRQNWRTGQVTLLVHAREVSLGFTLSLDTDPVAALTFTYDVRPWWTDGVHLDPEHGHEVFQLERRAVDCLVTFAPRGGGDDDEEEDRDHRDSSVLRGDDDGESEGCSDPDGRDDDEDDDWGDDDDNRGDDDDDESDEGVGMVHCHLTSGLWADARRAVLDAECDAIANLLVKADEILARIPLEEAKDTPVQDPSNQGRFDRELERAERALARAREAWDRDQHDDVIRHFEKAWKHAQNAMRIATR